MSSKMQSTFACPLTLHSRFCLSGPGVQRNCNATDLLIHGGSEITGSQLPASERDQRAANFARSNRTAGTASGGGCSKEAGGAGRRVEFTSAAASRSRSKRSRSCSRKQQLQLQTALLVPLACSNQSNKLHPLSGDWSTNNVQILSSQTETGTSKTQQTANPCEVPAGGGGGGGGGQELLASCGVPYWNVYEYEDFRELQHGKSHVFDPQVDAHLHRESIILDNYNRLQRSNPNFRPPTPTYHLR